MSRILAGTAVAIVAAWCLYSLKTPWTSAYVPHFWPHKVMGALALTGIGGLLLLARRRPVLALGLAAAGVAAAALYLVRRSAGPVAWSEVPGRFLTGTAGPALAGALLITACAGWGSLIGRRLAPDKSLSFPDRLVLGILVQAMLLLGAGSLGLLHPALAWTLLIGGTGAGLRDLREDFRWLRGIVVPSPVHCLWLAPGILTTLFGILRALAPELDGDSLRYHLALPQLYVKAGGTAFRPENAFSLLPSTSQMMHVASLLVSGDTPSRLLGVAAFVATLRAIFEWARRYESDRLPWIATGLLGAVVQWRETLGTAMAEPYLVLFATLSLHQLARAIEEPGGSRRSVVLAGLFAGGVAGSKLFGLLFPILVAAGMLLAEPRRWRAALGFCVIGILLACPWYLRSFLATGNPFWPSFASLFGGDAALLEQNGRLIESLRSRYAVSSSWWTFPLLPLYATFQGARYDVAWDPWILAWIPAALVSRRPTVLNVGLGMALGMVVILYGIYVPLTRFFAVLFPVVALAAAWPMGEFTTSGMRRLVTASFLGIALATSATHLPAVERALLPVLGFEDRERYPVSWIEGYSLSRYASRTLPADAKVLVVDFTDTYYLQRTVFWTDPTLQHELILSRTRDTGEILEYLRGRGIGYVVARGRTPFPDVPGDRDAFRILHASDGWSLFGVVGGSPR